MALTDAQIIVKLREWGHLWEVDQPDIPKLQLDDQVVCDGVRSLQGWMPRELDQLAALHHGRPAVHDGDIGPATEDLFNVPRCPLPDVPPPPNASFVYEDPHLQAAVQRMQASASIGKGSWPPGCHGDIYEGHCVTFHVNSQRSPRGREPFNAALHKCVEAYKQVGVLMHEVDDPDYADIHVSWKSLAGSTIGLAEFNNQACNDTVFCNLDPNYWPNIDQVARLLLHEWGHNHNLRHTRGGVMHPSILRGFEGWRHSDPSWGTLKRFYGGKPVKLDPTEPPAPRKKITGTIEVDGYGSQRFIIGESGGPIEW